MPAGWTTRPRLFFAHFYVVLLGVFQGAFEEAARIALSLDIEIPTVAAWHGIPAFHCYAGVALTQAADVVSPDERALFLARAELFAEKLSRWADLCPENLAHRSALLGAELERARGDARAAGDRYDEAIALAQRGGYLHDEALANELAGLSFRALGKTTIARAYLTEAHRAYGRWGATEAMRRLERAYPDLVPSEILRGATCPEAAAPASTALDLGSVLKASQAISARSSSTACSTRSCASWSRTPARGGAACSSPAPRPCSWLPRRGRRGPRSRCVFPTSPKPPLRTCRRPSSTTSGAAGRR